jgi:hypothetical protein
MAIASISVWAGLAPRHTHFVESACIFWAGEVADFHFNQLLDSPVAKYRLVRASSASRFHVLNLSDDEQL